MTYIYFLINLILSEVVFRTSAGIEYSMTMVLYFIAVIAAVFYLLCDIWNKKTSRILRYVFSVIIFFYYAVELVYQHIFKSFLSISQVGMGTDAISTYKTETLLGIGECAGYLFLLLVPMILHTVYIIAADKKEKKRIQKGTNKEESLEGAENVNEVWGRYLRNQGKKGYKKLNIPSIVVIIVCCFLIHNRTLAMVNSQTGAYSPSEVYNETFILSKSQSYFGCLTSTRLELRNMFFGSGTGSIVSEEPKNEDPIKEEPKYELNTLDIDFNALAETATDDRVKALDLYFASKKATRKNEYTGMFKDYNVITLVCESFSPYLIDEERTPILYKMANEGFVFNNYYGTVCDNTSNSEYTYITSLLPDTSLLGKGWDTFYKYNSCTASQENYIPTTMYNIFKNEGVRSIGFHYYYGNYYGRKTTHPNFGMEFYYMTKGLKKSEDWPTSDLEMMQQALPYFLKKNDQGKVDRFNAYFLSFSGHMYYRFDTNRIARINKEVSDGLPYSEATRAYVSCNQELEKALEYMVDELDKAGVLDNTLIVLIPDHYPYTLGLDKLSELAGEKLNGNEFDKEFNQYKGCLLMWSASMKEPIAVDDMVCELDILPTLLNLMDIDYDSRLYMGTDIFSDSEHIAILGDRSFITDKYYYNANNGEVTMKGSFEKDDADVERVINLVKNKFTVSTEILYTDYYKHAFGVN